MRGTLTAMIALGLCLLGNGIRSASGAPLTFVELNDVFNGATQVALSPDGQHLYVSTTDAIWMAERDPASGSIRFVQFVGRFAPGRDALGAVDDLAVSPDGLHVYTASSIVNALAILRRDPATGRLAFLGDVRTAGPDGRDLSGVWRVTVSRNAASVYAGGSSGRLITFRRDASTGALEYIQSVPVCPVGSSSCRVDSIAVSPDDRHVYAVGNDHQEAGAAQDVIAVFDRDPQQGTLTLVQEVRDGLGGHVDLPDLVSAIVSPDGRHVYAGGRDRETGIVSFGRDLESGILTVVQLVRIAPPEAGPRLTDRLAISPDGSAVYGAGNGGKTFSVFRRDSATGTLQLIADLRDGVDFDPRLAHLQSINGIVVGPESASVYAVAWEGVVNVFRRTCGDGHLDPGEACDDANAADADGCDSGCNVEQCFRCTGAPSACVPADGEACDDGDACTLSSVCAAGRCSGGAPASDGEACEDGDACTVGDVCSAGRCAPGAPLTCGACEACDRTLGCVGVLASGCRVSPGFRGPAGRLSVRDRASGSRSSEWEWVGRVVRSEIVAPELTGDYEFCVFDGAFLQGGSRRRHLVSGGLVPADATCGGRSCWRRRRDGGLRFRSPESANRGVRSLTLRPAGKRGPSIQITGRSTAGGTDPLPLAGVVTAQLRTEAGACWESHFDPFIETNDTRAFRGRAGLHKCRKFQSCD